MKKLLAFIASLFLIVSCSLEEDNRVDFHMEFIAAEHVEVPEAVTPGQTYPIKLFYRLPNDCYNLDGFYYEIEDNVRTVAIQSIVFDNVNCSPVTTTEAQVTTLNFECPPVYANNSYVFKFYKGNDAEGNQQFIEVEVPVVHQ